jgi:PAS domain S-box-containing protein
MIGWSAEELQGRSAPHVYCPEEEMANINNAFHGMLEGNSPHEGYELIFARKDGTRFPVHVTIVALREGGRQTGCLANFLDITERKRAEAEREKLETQLLQAQKMEAIGTLAGGIAHDFNNILQSIIIYAELAQDDMPKDSPALSKMDKILTASNRARDLVGRILAFSRQTEEESVLLQLQPVVKEALKLLRGSLSSTIRPACRLKTGRKYLASNASPAHYLVGLHTVFTS